jgi:type I restriction enzyme S subunit
VRIEKIAKEVKSTNGSNQDIPVLSCTKYDGLVDSLSYFGKQVFSVDTSKYKVVKKGQFAYATNHIEEGSIGYQNLYPKGLVSPMYTVFETNQFIDDSYLYKVLKTDIYRHIFQVNTSASVDRRGSLRWKEFAKLPIPLPPMKEQKRIADILNTARKEIDLLKKQLEAFRKQKRGLMQKLLTGQWRVKITGVVDQ